MIKDRGKPGSQGEDENKLWQVVTRDIKKLRHREKVAAQEALATPKATSSSKPKAGRSSVPNEPRPATGEKPARMVRSGGTDGKTADKIRKGDMAIEGRLDLHGHTAEAARKKLLAFILSSYRAGKRCVLLITGKGGQGDKNAPWYEAPKGVIKREFRQWLEDPSVQSCILSITEAQPRHGGSGAHYIYLRKNKS